MYLIIVGAGPVGSSLVELAIREGCKVVLIEKKEHWAQQASEKFDAMVLNADIAAGSIMEEAGADQADALVATTGDDASNLMAMFLGAEAGIKTLVSVVNETSHQQMFKHLGVHILLDPEVIVARHLYGIICQPRVEDMVTLEEGGQVFRVQLNQNSPLIDKTMAEAVDEGLLPKEFSIVAVKQKKKTVIPTGETKLHAGDHLTVYSQETVHESNLKVFTGEQDQ